MNLVTPPGLGARMLGAARRAAAYWQRQGTRATLERLGLEWQRRRAAARAEPVPPSPTPWPAPRAAAGTPADPDLAPVQALRTWWQPPHGRRRVSVVVDGLDHDGLLGGLGTALILGTLLANRRAAVLRVISRVEPPLADHLDEWLRVHGLELQRESQFVFAPHGDPQAEVDLLHDETVITTSWRATAAVLPSVPAPQIVALVQEDERMDHPYGDDRRRCQELLRHEGLRHVVATRALLDHLAADGVPQLRQRALSFEPAAPAALFHRRPRLPGARPRFVFVARPRHPRHLFALGAEAVAAAIERGVLAQADWEIAVVGRGLPEQPLGPTCTPRRCENPDLAAYADLIGGADLVLSLNHAPHPGDPPLDLLASGAVVVTNRFGRGVSSRAAIDDGVICCEPRLADLVEGLAHGVERVRTRGVAAATPRAPLRSRDWPAALAVVLEQLDGAG